MVYVHACTLQMFPKLMCSVTVSSVVYMFVPLETAVSHSSTPFSWGSPPALGTSGPVATFKYRLTVLL